MAKDATFQVRLDTRAAEADLRNIAREGRAASGRVGNQLGQGGQARGIGGGRAFGLGAVAGVAVAQGRRITGSVFGGLGDVFEDLTAGIRADVDRGIKADESRGNNRALKAAQDAYGAVVRGEGDLGNAVRYSKLIGENFRSEEVGRTRIAQAVGGQRAESKDGKGPLDRLLDPIISEIKQGFVDLVKAVTGISLTR